MSQKFLNGVLVEGGDLSLSGGNIYNTSGTLIIQNNAGAMVDIKSNQGIRFYIDKNNDDTSRLFEILANTDAYDANNVVATVSQLGNATFAGDIIGGGSITIGSGGGYNAGAIYSDANWGMIFRALQASPNNSDFMFANSADVERLRITSTGATFAGSVTTSSILAASNFTLDVGGNITLDADSGSILLKDGGTQYLTFTKSGNDAHIVANRQDGDIKFFGNDGGSSITALTLDMSEGGNATFAGTVTANGTVLTGDQTLPTDFVSAANGGTFSGNIAVQDISMGAADKFTHGNYLELSYGASNTSQFTFNADYDGAQTGTYTPHYSGTTSSGMSIVKMPSGGVGGLDFYVKQHGTTSGSHNISTFTKILELNQNGTSTFGGNVTVGGDLIISGTTTTLNTQTVEVEDNILQLNTTQGSPDTATAATSGISIYRGDGVTQASLIFDDGDDTWDLTNNLKVAGDINIGNYQLKQDANSYLTFDDDTTTHSPDTNTATLASVSGIALATNTNDGGGGNFTVSTGSTGTQLLRIQTSGDATFAGRVIIGDDAITTDKPGLVVGDTTNNGQITIRGGQPTLFFDKSGTNDAVILTDGVSLKFKNGTLDSEGSDQLTLDTSGNATFTGGVGIGLTASTSLHVTGASLTNNVAAVIGGGWVGNDAYHKEGGLLLISGTNTSQTGAGIAFQTRNTVNTNYWKSSIIMDRDGAMRFTLGGAGTGAGSNDFTILSNGNATFTGDVIGASFAVPSGASTGFLKADGSVDGTTYSGYNFGATDLTFQGADPGDIVWKDANGTEVHRIWSGSNDYLTYRNDAGTTYELISAGSTSYNNSNWDTAYTHSQAAHAPSNAEQNVQSDWDATSGDALILNKPSTFSPSAHNHDDRYYTESEVNQNLAALKGWVPAYSNSDASTINWNFTTNSLEIQSDTDTTTGASFQARRIEEGETIRVTFMAKASAAASSGLYIRLYQHNGNLPDGKTHVSNNASASSVLVQEDDGAYTAWTENGAVTTDWVTYEKTYTATSDGYVSLVVLNWSGIGTNTLYVTNPDIQTTTAGDSDKLDGQEGTHYLDYNNFTNTPTIPTDFVSKASGGTFAGDVDFNSDVTINGITSGGAVTSRTLNFTTNPTNAGLSGANEYLIGEVAFTGKDSSTNAAGKYIRIKGSATDGNTTVQGSAGEGGKLVFTLLRHDVGAQPRVEYDVLTLQPSSAILAGDVTINSAGTAASPILRLNNSSSSTFNHALEAINDNLTAGETELLLFGKETNSRNSGFIGFNWNADDDNSNYVTIGHWGYNHLVKIFPTGNTTFAGTITASGYNNSNWDTAYTHSQAAHAPSNAEANVQADWNATSGDAQILNKLNREFVANEWGDDRFKRTVTGTNTTAGSTGDTWVKLSSVDITSAYHKVKIKFSIGSSDDNARGREQIDVLYENDSTAQENHQLRWYAGDDLPTLFKAVKSIRSASSGTSNTYDVYVQMDQDWQDNFTVHAEWWRYGGSISYPTTEGSSTTPTAGSDDKSLTSRQRWVDADLLDGQQGTYYLDYGNFTNTPTIPTDFVSAANGGTFSGPIAISDSAGAAWLSTMTNSANNGHGLLIQAGGTTGTRYITQWKDAAGTERFHMDDTGEAYFQNSITAGAGTFAGALRITETGTAQHILIGNQDSAGVNKPGMIRSANAVLEFGYGNSWAGEGGTMSTTLKLDTSNNAYFSGNVYPVANGTQAFGGTSNRWDVGYFNKVRITNVVTNKILKFDGTDIDDSIMSDDGSTVQVSGDFDVTGAASFGSFSLGSLAIDGYKMLDMPSSSTERGAWNPIVAAVRGSGYAIYPDEDFHDGSNSISVYNNQGGTGVVHTRETDATTLGQTAPNSSGYVIRITMNGNATSPGYGGFVQNIPASDNDTYVQIFQAKLPNGYNIADAQNAQGSNSTNYWLTSQAGTGKWEWYARVAHNGDSGTFSSGGHVYVLNHAGSSSTFSWYLASCNLIKVTDGNSFNKRQIFSKDLYVDNRIYHNGNTGNYLAFGTDTLSLTATNTTAETLKLNSELQFLRGSGEYSNYIRSSNYPSENYSSSTGKYWLEYGAKGGHHFVLNTDGGSGSAENDFDDFTIWNGEVDGDRLLEVTNAGNTSITGGLNVGGRTEIADLRLRKTGTSDQVTTTDTASAPAGGNELIRFEGNYTDGKYTHELVKIDRGGNLPLYLQESKGTANSFSNLVRFGTHSNSSYEFEVFGEMKATGADFTGNVSVITGSTSGSLEVGRTSSEKITLLTSDVANSITAFNDSDGNSTHDFILNRSFGGTGSNNFRIQKGGTTQFLLNTNGTILHTHYGGSYGSEDTSGFISNAASGRGTMRIRSATDAAAELFFDIDGGIRWDISVRGSSESHVMRWYPAASTPSLTGVSAHVMELTQSGTLSVSSTISSGGSNVLTAATTFAGDVTGTAGAMVVGNDTHTHDTRYYTESEMQTFFNRGYINSHSTSNAPVGWYTIATNTGDRALAQFQIWDTASSDHQSVLFNASHHFGTDSSNDITVTANSRYSGTNFRYIRIKEGGTYDGAALQVYIDGSSNSCSVAIVGGNAQEAGWVIKDWIADGTDPGDLTSYSSMTERTIVDLDLIINGGMITTGPIFSGGQTTQYKVLTGQGGGAQVIEGTGVAAAPLLNLTNTSSSTFNHSLEALAANMTAGESNILVVGKAGSTKNSGYIGYYYTAAGSNNNFVSIGQWAQDHLFRVYGDQIISTVQHSIWGNVNIGTASDTNQRRLYLHGSTANKKAELKCTDGNLHIDAADGNALYLNYYYGGSTNIVFGTGNTGHCGTISSTGVLRMSNDIVAFYSFSDKRLKKNVKSTKNNLDKILSLRPVEYEWKQGPREGVKEIGLIAQEVEKVVPEVVREISRHDDEKIEGVNYKQVDYEHLVSTLIGAMQEQQDQINDLKKEIQTLKNK